MTIVRRLVKTLTWAFARTFDAGRCIRNVSIHLIHARFRRLPLDHITAGQRLFPVPSGTRRVPRNSDYGSEGWAFESLRTRQISPAHVAFDGLRADHRRIVRTRLRSFRLFPPASAVENERVGGRFVLQPLASVLVGRLRIYADGADPSYPQAELLTSTRMLNRDRQGSSKRLTSSPNRRRVGPRIVRFEGLQSFGSGGALRHATSGTSTVA
jgi:hypothetical protein